MNNKLYRIDFSDFSPVNDRIIRFKQFLTKSAFPNYDEAKNCLHFVADPGLIFESFDQIKKEQIYSNLYSTIIENLWSFGKPNEIESFVVLIDKIALTACIQLEDRGADENKFFAAIKSNTWHKDQFNSFQQCLLLKLCAIWIDNYKSSGTPANTKQDVFGKLCDDESRSIGNSIGFQMPTLSFCGIWITKKHDKPAPAQTSNKEPVSTNEKESIPINGNENSFSTEYETEKFKEIFFSKAIEKYIDIEKRLLDDKFIDAKCLWGRQKKELVALIHILNNKKYLKPIPKRSKNSYFKYYKYFFESRYNIDITELAKPSKFPIIDLSSYEPIFHFIPDLK